MIPSVAFIHIFQWQLICLHEEKNPVINSTRIAGIHIYPGKANRISFLQFSESLLNLVLVILHQM
jgi:hypothetical protein